MLALQLYAYHKQTYNWTNNILEAHQNTTNSTLWSQKGSFHYIIALHRMVNFDLLTSTIRLSTIIIISVWDLTAKTTNAIHDKPAYQIVFTKPHILFIVCTKFCSAP